jgi:hypothetical protein
MRWRQHGAMVPAIARTFPDFTLDVAEGVAGSSASESTLGLSGSVCGAKVAISTIANTGIVLSQ